MLLLMIVGLLEGTVAQFPSGAHEVTPVAYTRPATDPPARMMPEWPTGFL